MGATAGGGVMTTLAEIREALAPLFGVPGDRDRSEGVMRRCQLCGRTSRIVSAVDPAVIDHEAGCIVAAFPSDAVLVTPKALAAAIEDHFATGRHGWSYTSCATAVVMAISGVAGEESDVTHADAPSPLRAEGAPSEGARLG